MIKVGLVFSISNFFIIKTYQANHGLRTPREEIAFTARPKIQSESQIFRYGQSISLSKAELLQLKLIHLFARELFLMKKLEIEKTKPTFIISVLKVDY